jgi:hypothetical protein
MMANDFTVLIGSVARRTHGHDSDVDILRIDHKRSVPAALCVPAGMHVSYVDYDRASFMEFHTAGSLFLHHAFTEGLLLEGDATHWQRLKARFSVAKDFSEAIADYKAVLDYVRRPPAFSSGAL